MSHHQYSRHPDHIRRRNVPAPDNAAIDNHLKELLGTSVYSQQAYYRSLGMRDRILTLPLMVAAVVTLLWHQVPSVHELTRMLNRKDLLWAKATKVRLALKRSVLESNCQRKYFVLFPVKLPGLIQHNCLQRS